MAVRRLTGIYVVIRRETNEIYGGFHLGTKESGNRCNRPSVSGGYVCEPWFSCMRGCRKVHQQKLPVAFFVNDLPFFTLHINGRYCNNMASSKHDMKALASRINQTRQTVTQEPCSANLSNR